jgi:hypothetical protein
MCQRHTRQRLPNQMLDVICRTDLNQIRRFGDQVRLVHLGPHGQVHFGIAQILVVSERRGVDRRLGQFERQRDEIARHYGIEQQAYLLIQILETKAQFVVLVLGKVARVDVRLPYDSMVSYNSAGCRAVSKC